jgi:hypothetical protein
LSSRGALIAIIEENQTSGTAGQTLTEDVDNIRVLNTLVYNRDSLVSVSSNRFTLPAGTWEIAWRAPARGGDGGEHQSFLYNQTDSTEVKRGESNGFAGNESADFNSSNGHTVVTITGSKAFEIRHRLNNDAGLEYVAGSFATEVGARVVVRRA